MRLFIGIEFPPAIVDALFALQGELRKLVQKGRFPAKENLHLTLQFLGETPESRITDISRRLEAVASRHVPFRLLMGDRLGYFGPVASVRVVWLGVQGELTALSALRVSVSAAMREAGFVDEDRAYNPHITLARDVTFFSGTEKLQKGWIDFFVGQISPVEVRQFSLISSILEEGKPRYRVIKSFSLESP